MDNEAFSQFLQFISKYGRTYPNREVFEFRRGVFTQNYKRIVEHNLIPDSGFELEVN